jgi:hypothetical protein
MAASSVLAPPEKLTMRRLLNAVSSLCCTRFASGLQDLLFIVNLLGFLEFGALGGSFDLGTFVAKSASLPQFTRDFYS